MMKVDLCVKKTCMVVLQHDATVDDKGQEHAKPPDDEILQKDDVCYYLYNI